MVVGLDVLPQLKLGYNYVWNTVKLQGPLDFICGIYCLYFLHHRCRGWSLHKILKSLPTTNHRKLLLKWFLSEYSFWFRYTLVGAIFRELGVKWVLKANIQSIFTVTMCSTPEVLPPLEARTCVNNMFLIGEKWLVVALFLSMIIISFTIGFFIGGALLNTLPTDYNARPVNISQVYWWWRCVVYDIYLATYYYG